MKGDVVHKERSKETPVPLVFCRGCHGWQVARVQTYVKKKGKKCPVKLEVTIISCSKCDIVKNIDRVPKLRWANWQYLTNRGWKKAKPYKKHKRS